MDRQEKRGIFRVLFISLDYKKDVKRINSKMVAWVIATIMKVNNININMIIINCKNNNNNNNVHDTAAHVCMACT